jgi:cyclic pyranopterin phosphate synthase
MGLTHLTGAGDAHMVDVGAKSDVHRIAEAQAMVSLSAAAYDAIVQGNLKKGDALGAARIAGIMAAKRTSDLIPLCHPLTLTRVEVEISPEPPPDATGRGEFRIRTRVECIGKTGVEMEALTAASIAALTLYDMAKAIDRAIVIQDLHLLSKSGGQSGDFTW